MTPINNVRLSAAQEAQIISQYKAGDEGSEQGQLSDIGVWAE